MRLVSNIPLSPSDLTYGKMLLTVEPKVWRIFAIVFYPVEVYQIIDL